MKPISAIELLNKIVNGDDIPNAVLYIDKTYYWDDELYDYKTEKGLLLFRNIHTTELLNTTWCIED